MSTEPSHPRWRPPETPALDLFPASTFVVGYTYHEPDALVFYRITRVEWLEPDRVRYTRDDGTTKIYNRAEPLVFIPADDAEFEGL